MSDITYRKQKGKQTTKQVYNNKSNSRTKSFGVRKQEGNKDENFDETRKIRKAAKSSATT